MTCRATSGARSHSRALQLTPPGWGRLVDLEGAANGVGVDEVLEFGASVVNERVVDLDLLEAERGVGGVGEEAFECACACAGGETEGQADLVGAMLEGRPAGAVAVAVERLQLFAKRSSSLV